MMIGVSIALLIVAVFFRILFKFAAVLRLSIPLAYTFVISMFLSDWYQQNTFLAEAVFYIMLALVVLSWVVTIRKKLRLRKQQKIEAQLAEQDTL